MGVDIGQLNDLQLRAWVSAKEPIARSDEDGLTFTLSPSGRASWVLRFRHGGRAKEKTLGHYPDMSLGAARKQAAEDRLKVSQGIDVAAEKQRKKREDAAAWSFRKLAEDYLQKAEGRLPTSFLS